MGRRFDPDRAHRYLIEIKHLSLNNLVSVFSLSKTFNCFNFGIDNLVSVFSLSKTNLFSVKIIERVDFNLSCSCHYKKMLPQARILCFH